MGSFNSDGKEGESYWRSKMKLFYDDTVEPRGKKPCDGVRDDLRECLMTSDCYLKHRKTLKECLRVDDGTVPQECIALRTTFFECKRSLLDNRQRFRGRKGY